MVKKAEELQSLKELNLSSRARSYYKQRGSINELVKTGRVLAYTQERDGVSLCKYNQELVDALREAGYIRPADDFKKTFKIATLYAWSYQDIANKFICRIQDITNEQYEGFQPLTDEEIDTLEDFMKQHLTSVEYDVLVYSLNLMDFGPSRTLNQTKEFLGLKTREIVRSHEATALRKLRIANLPAIFKAPSCDEETAEMLYNELKELYNTTVFKRAREIIQELEDKKKNPFKYSCEYFKPGTQDFRSINDLDLSIRSYNSLHRAGIMTVSDIIKKENWADVKNFGRKNAKEVTELMRQLGYKDFIIEMPEKTETLS